MGIIDEKQDMHEAAHDFYREEESRLEAEQEAKEIEMLTEAEEWAYDAPWLPTSIEPPAHKTVLAVVVGDSRNWTSLAYFDGKTFEEVDDNREVVAWLPMPEVGK